MAISMRELNDALKKKYYDMIEELAKEKEFDALRVPLTDSSESVAYKIAIPELDSENNEKTVIISITVPTGGRDGQEYDLYGEHDRYLYNVKQNEEKKAAREAESARRRQRKCQRRKRRRKAFFF